MSDTIEIVETFPPVHPGEIMRTEFLVPFRLTAGRVAKAIGISRSRIERLVAGDIGISGDTAIRLGRFFGTTPQFWLNLQKHYELEKPQPRSAMPQTESCRSPGQPDAIEFGTLILPFAGVEPVFAGKPRHCGEGSSVLGRAIIGADLRLGPFATIRADGNTVTIGDDVCLGEGSTVHIAQDLHPTLIGHRVSVGRNAVVHACTIGDDGVIEDDVVVLDGSVVGDGVLIEAGSTVYPRSRLGAHGHYAGSPAVLIGTVSADDVGRRAAAIRAAAERPTERTSAGVGEPPPDGHFVAETAVISGSVTLAPRAGVFFGCRLRASALTVGERTNIQDNCVIETSGDVAIGRETTLGHNVRMAQGRIGARSLVGIGAVLAEGTVVEDDVLVAAGTITTAGQVLDSGWLWGGRPARPLKRLDAARRAMMAETVRHYVDYGRDYRLAQIAAAERHRDGR